MFQYQTERQCCSTSVAMNILFAHDISLDADLEPELFCSKLNSNAYLAEKNDCVSRVRESERNESKCGRKSVSFADVFGDKTVPVGKSLSFENVDVDDDLFLPSDVGKEMLLKDEENHTMEFLIKRDSTCTPSSLWTLRSTWCEPDHSPQQDVDYNQSNCRRLGEHSKSRSTFSDGPFRQRVYFGPDASTPVADRRVSLNFSKMKESVPKLSIQDQHESPTSLGTTPSPMLLYSVRKAHYPEDYRYYIGETIYNKIQRLKAEEKRKASVFVGEFAFSLDCSSISAETPTRVFRSSSSSFGFEETTMKYSTETSLESNQKDSLVEYWTVQPQKLTLDVGNKGGRLLLINNSGKDLKFQTKYDSRKTNVNPVTGNLPAKGQIGLRILVSRFLRGRLKEDIEDTVLITCGKKEKTVEVKIRKEQKSKNTSRKDRSYICF